MGPLFVALGDANVVEAVAHHLEAGSVEGIEQCLEDSPHTSKFYGVGL